MSQLDMKELYSTVNEKTLKRMETYDNILQKCHKRIKYNATLQRPYCFFQIPEFIIGVPLYNIEDLKEYLMKSLKKDGFEYMYIDPNWLFVTWELINSKKIPQTKHKKKNQGEYKLIDEYKPSGNLYNDYDMSTMRQKMNELM